MEAEKDKKTGDGSEHITLKVLGQDENEVFFRIRRDTKLKCLMNAYRDRVSADMNAIRFLFDARRVRGEQTPDEAGLEDGDEIDAVLEQVGGNHKKAWSAS